MPLNLLNPTPQTAIVFRWYGQRIKGEILPLQTYLPSLQIFWAGIRHLMESQWEHCLILSTILHVCNPGWFQDVENMVDSSLSLPLYTSDVSVGRNSEQTYDLKDPCFPSELASWNLHLFSQEWGYNSASQFYLSIKIEPSQNQKELGTHNEKTLNRKILEHGLLPYRAWCLGSYNKFGVANATSQLCNRRPSQEEASPRRAGSSSWAFRHLASSRPPLRLGPQWPWPAATTSPCFPSSPLRCGRAAGKSVVKYLKPSSN